MILLRICRRAVSLVLNFLFSQPADRWSLSAAQPVSIHDSICLCVPLGRFSKSVGLQLRLFDIELLI